MLSARDELAHLADTVDEPTAERILTLVRRVLPGLYTPAPDGESPSTFVRRMNAQIPEWDEPAPFID